MCVHRYGVEKHDVDNILAQFDSLDVDNNGTRPVCLFGLRLEGEAHTHMLSFAIAMAAAALSSSPHYQPSYNSLPRACLHVWRVCCAGELTAVEISALQLLMAGKTTEAHAARARAGHGGVARTPGTEASGLRRGSLISRVALRKWSKRAAVRTPS